MKESLKGAQKRMSLLLSYRNILSCQGIVKEIEVLETSQSDRPKQRVVMTDSGIEEGFNWPYEVPKTGVFV